MNNPTHVGNRVWSFDEVFTVACIIEEMIDPSGDRTRPWQAYRDHYGISQLRDLVITTLAHAADQAWTRANDLHEQAFAQWQLDCDRIKQVGGDLPGQPVEPGSFDYEFLPFWLRACVDWSDISDVRVRTTVS